LMVRAMPAAGRQRQANGLRIGRVDRNSIADQLLSCNKQRNLLRDRTVSRDSSIDLPETVNAGDRAAVEDFRRTVGDQTETGADPDASGRPYPVAKTCTTEPRAADVATVFRALVWFRTAPGCAALAAAAQRQPRPGRSHFKVSIRNYAPPESPEAPLFPAASLEDHEHNLSARRALAARLLHSPLPSDRRRKIAECRGEGSTAIPFHGES
jgi:hypothetical protein